MDPQAEARRYPHAGLRRSARRIALTVALTVAGLSFFAFILISVFARHGRIADPGWTCRTSRDGCIVTHIATSAAAFLQTGDRILRINDRAGIATFGPELALAPLRPDSAYSVTLQRGRARLQLVLRMGVQEGASLADISPNLALGFVLFATGIGLVFAGGTDLTSRLAAATFLVAIFPVTSSLLLDYPGWSARSAATALLLFVVWQPWHIVLAWDFLSHFPHPVRPWRLTRRALYSIGALLWASVNIPAFANIAGLGDGFRSALPLRFSVWFGSASPAGSPAVFVAFEALTGVAAGFALLVNYNSLHDAGSRRRIRWAASGFALTTVTYLCFKLLQMISAVTGFAAFADAAAVVGAGVLLSMAVSIFALTYAIARHRVLGIRVAIRRGIQYIFAKQVLRLVLVLPAVIILIKLVREPNRSVAEMAFHSSWYFYFALTISAAISLRYRRAMTRWLDHRFFRTTLEQEQALAALIDHLRGASSEEEIASIVTREIERALRVDGIHVLLRPSLDSPLSVAFSFGRDDAVRIRNLLNASGREFSSARLTTVPWQQESNVDASADADSGAVKEILVLPLLGSEEREIGNLVLGPRKSEEPYTQRDIELLQAVAAQAAVMYDVLRLRRRVEADARERTHVLGHLHSGEIRLLSECPRCGCCYDSMDQVCALDGAALTLTLPVERTVEGKYHLERRIGHGGMGVVFEALDLDLKRAVAVKIMTGDLFGNKAALARFTREARAAAHLNHPHIVAVHNFGTLAAGGAYLVMELVRGKSWRNHLQEPAGLSPRRVAAWLEQLCAAVSAAHASGVIHRDLKPENIMISDGDEQGRAMVLDFGIAKVKSALGAADFEITAAGTVLGTQSYMSPEQRAGGEVDARTDIYAIGIIAIETLSGLRPPRKGVDKVWVAKALARFADADGGLARVFRAALEKDPRRRTRSAAELGQILPAAICAEAREIPLASAADAIDTMSI